MWTVKVRARGDKRYFFLTECGRIHAYRKHAARFPSEWDAQFFINCQATRLKNYEWRTQQLPATHTEEVSHDPALPEDLSRPAARPEFRQ